MDFSYQGRHPPATLAAMATGSHYTQSTDPWVSDTGSTNHLTANIGNLSMQQPYKGNDHVTVGIGQALPINNIGNGILKTPLFNFNLCNILHVPRIASNLLSIHKLCKDNNCRCRFDVDHFCIQYLHLGRVLYKGLSENGLYPIYPSNNCDNISNAKSLSHKPCVCTSFSAQSITNRWLLWHQGLGHPCSKTFDIGQGEQKKSDLEH